MVGRGVRAGILLVVGALLGPTAAAGTEPVVSAHRARVSGLSENSLAGFAAAVAAGETDVEGDTHVTRDGVLVVSHDSPLRAPRCSGPHLDVPLRQLAASQVDDMTCGGEPVARLTDVLEVLRPHPGVTLRIEIKHGQQDPSTVRRDDAVRLARVVAAGGMTPRTILQDFSWAVTTGDVRTASPGQRVSALATTITVAGVDAAAAAGAYDFSYGATLSSSFWNRYIAATGLRSAVWTVNDPTLARALRAKGVGTIISDVPSTLRAALAAPDSGCVLSGSVRSRAPASQVTVAAGGRLHLVAARRAPDGRVVESVPVRITARTATGTAELQVAPQGTPTTPTWERGVGVTSTARSTVVVTPLGDHGGVRIRNTASRAVTLTATVVGATVHTCR